MRTLVLGGIRSGKSQWAEDWIARAAGPDGPVRYVATGSVDGDADFAARVSAHQNRRPVHWSTVESADVVATLRDSAATMVDDIGGWLVAAMDRRAAWTGAGRAADASSGPGTRGVGAAEAASAAPGAFTSGAFVSAAFTSPRTSPLT